MMSRRWRWALIFPAIIIALYLGDELSRMKNVRFSSVSMQDVTISEFLNKTKIADHEKVYYFLGADKAKGSFNYTGDVISPIGYVIDDICTRYEVSCFILPFGFLIFY
jgi:hypothetical protein